MEEYHMKPTTIIASALKMLRELDGWRGLCVNVVMCRRRVLHGQWADGLKRAIVVALRHRKWCAEASLAKLSPTSLEACGNNMC